MLFQSGRPVMIFNLKLLSLLPFASFIYNNKTQQFVIPGQIQRKKYRFRVFLLSGIVWLLVVNGIHTMIYSHGLTPSRKGFVGIFTLGFSTAMTVAFPLLNNPDDFLTLMNLINGFEASYFLTYYTGKSAIPINKFLLLELPVAELLPVWK